MSFKKQHFSFFELSTDLTVKPFDRTMVESSYHGPIIQSNGGIISGQKHCHNCILKLLFSVLSPQQTIFLDCASKSCAIKTKSISEPK